MVAAVTTVGGYGSGAIQPDGSLLVDTEEGQSVVAPVFTADGSGNVTGATVSPSAPNLPGMPIQNAILIELRLITSLLTDMLGDKAPDTRALRAELAFNILPATGLP